MFVPDPLLLFVVEHCSHVCMSVSKLMGRIVATDAVEGAEELHDYTFGITSDPLTQFAVVFVALIHDVDHQGVSNIQLFKEESELSKYYRGKSIAEQNSIDIAWDVLMQDCFVDLRHAIYSNEQELKRFRQLLVNIVLATDIADKELKAARNDRWAKAFSGDKNPSTKKEDSNLAVNRKATIVLEHIIQASDVAHTMQHWHIYKKWNQRLFLELYAAHKAGRLEAHPATFWAKGEIGFFDYYIIPLAEKLGECGVFGVSGDEYLTYALANRTEWDAKGEAVVAEYMAEIEAEEKQSLEMDA